jgi:hypothetical protein
MKGILSWVGGRTEVVEYTVQNVSQALRNSMDGSYGTWRLKG